MSRELFNPLFSKIGLTSTELDSIYGGGEIPEELTAKVSQLLSTLTTHEAAKSNQDIRNAIIASTLDGVEKSIFGYAGSNFSQLLTKEQLAEAKKRGNTSSRAIELMKLLASAYTGKIDELKANANQTKEKANEALTARIGELEEALTGANTKYGELEQLLEQTKKDHHNNRVKSELMRIMSPFVWKDQSSSMVQLFTEKVLNDSMNGAAFLFDENGNFDVRNKADHNLGVFNKDGDQTKRLTPEGYVKMIAFDFLSKNGASTTTEQSASIPVIGEIDTSKMSPTAKKAFELRQQKLRNIN